MVGSIPVASSWAGIRTAVLWDRMRGAATGGALSLSKTTYPANTSENQTKIKNAGRQRNAIKTPLNMAVTPFTDVSLHEMARLSHLSCGSRDKNWRDAGPRRVAKNEDVSLTLTIFLTRQKLTQLPTNRRHSA